VTAPLGPIEMVFSLAGIELEIHCPDAVVAALVGGRLSALVPGRTAQPPGRVVIDIRGPLDDPTWPPRPSGPGRSIYDAPAGPIEYFDDHDALFVHYGDRVRLRCLPAVGRIELGITGDHPGDLILATHPLLTLALLETMKRFGQFPLHAGAVSLRGEGLLLPGTSGAGKSTLTIAMVRAGFDFLGDDTVFLAHDQLQAGDIVASGFPDEVDVTESTVALIPELASLAGRPLRPGRDKHGFRVDEVFDRTPVAATRPVALVFPSVDRNRTPTLESLPAGEALFELTPNVLLTDPAAAQAHLDMLAHLVETTPAFTLHSGADLDAATALLADLIS
jgi:hypothetical protein